MASREIPELNGHHLYTWEEHLTKWGFFQQSMFDYQRVQVRYIPWSRIIPLLIHDIPWNSPSKSTNTISPYHHVNEIYIYTYIYIYSHDISQDYPHIFRWFRWFRRHLYVRRRCAETRCNSLSKVPRLGSSGGSLTSVDFVDGEAINDHYP